MRPTGRWARVYPALFAAYPVINMAAGNPTYYRADELAAVALVAVAGTLVVQVAVYAALRTRVRHAAAVDLAAAVTLGLVALFYGFGLVDRARAAAAANPAAGAVTVAVIVAAAIVVAVALWRGRHKLARGRHRLARVQPTAVDGFVRFATLCGMLLVGGSAARVAGYFWRARAVTQTALARELARPVPTRAPAGTSGARGPQRDVYVILLDEYASPEVYRERFGFDARAFGDSLRALGFRVPVSVRSNYPSTPLSVASLLNFAHMRPLEDQMPPGTRPSWPAVHLVEHNRAARFLKARGYRFVFFPSTWYSPTRRNGEADEVFDASPGFDLARGIYGSQIASHFAFNSMLRLAMPRIGWPGDVFREETDRTLRGVAALAARPEATFSVAHILLPHTPVLFDAACRPVPSSAPLPGQVQCVNRLVLRTVREILARSSVPPIIVIEGDHGTQTLMMREGVDSLPTPAQAAERFRTFGAYYLPDGGAAAVPDSVSVVNVLRYVFGYYFDADLPPLPNTMYYPSPRKPYAMAEIGPDFRVVAPPLPRQAAR